MVSKELIDLLIAVVKSWQVIAITIVIVFYIYLVTYVTRSYHRPRAASKTKVKKKKVTPPKGPEVAEPGASVNDELGLEES